MLFVRLFLAERWVFSRYFLLNIIDLFEQQILAVFEEIITVQIIIICRTKKNDLLK